MAWARRARDLGLSLRGLCWWRLLSLSFLPSFLPWREDLFSAERERERCLRSWYLCLEDPLETATGAAGLAPPYESKTPGNPP